MWQGKLVDLGPVQREYLPKYVEWLNDWEVAQYLMPGIPQTVTLDGETEWFETRQRERDSIVFAILARPEGNLIGNCGLQRIDLKNRCAQFGIFIGDKSYWGRGFGTDATRTLLHFGFEQLGLHRVELEVYAFNPRATRAYEKAGFRRDGTRRQALFRNGEFHDIHIMSILRDELRPDSPQ